MSKKVNLDGTKKDAISLLKWLQKTTIPYDGIVFSGRNGGYFAGIMDGKGQVPVPYCILDSARVWRGQYSLRTQRKRLLDTKTLLRYSLPIGDLLKVISPGDAKKIDRWVDSDFEIPQPKLTEKKLLIVDDVLCIHRECSTAEVQLRSIEAWGQNCAGFASSSCNHKKVDYYSAHDHWLITTYMKGHVRKFMSEFEQLVKKGVKLSKFIVESYEFEVAEKKTVS